MMSLISYDADADADDGRVFNDSLSTTKMAPSILSDSTKQTKCIQFNAKLTNMPHTTHICYARPWICCIAA